jgi:hypothetical protein
VRCALEERKGEMEGIRDDADWDERRHGQARVGQQGHGPWKQTDGDALLRRIGRP